jgi:hypothetical protein
VCCTGRVDHECKQGAYAGASLNRLKDYNALVQRKQGEVLASANIVASMELQTPGASAYMIVQAYRDGMHADAGHTGRASF